MQNYIKKSEKHRKHTKKNTKTVKSVLLCNNSLDITFFIKVYLLGIEKLIDKMKILQIGKFYPIIGGVEKVMFDLTSGFAAIGVECNISANRHEQCKMDVHACEVEKNE